MSSKWTAANWVLYDYTTNYLPRRDAFQRLRGLGFTAREAVELLHSVEKEG